MNRQLQPINTPSQRIRQLEAEFAQAREKLQDAEKTLAEEQAAVNAFRMHCRLTIGHWVDTLIELRFDKQGLLTQKRLLMQDLELEEETEEEPKAKQAEKKPHQSDVDALAESILEELIDEESQREAEKTLYRELARRFHPDLAGNNIEKAYRTSIMAAVNVAYQRKDIQTLRDLAGEIDPDVVAEIEAIDSVAVRKLRQRIVRCQRYERKVFQQLSALRQENTAKLWQKSQEIEQTQSSDWWQEIKRHLEKDVVTLEEEVAALKVEVGKLEKLKDEKTKE